MGEALLESVIDITNDPEGPCGCPISCRGWSGGMFVFVDEAIAAGRSDESKGQRVVSRVVVGGGARGGAVQPMHDLKISGGLLVDGTAFQSSGPAASRGWPAPVRRSGRSCRSRWWRRPEPTQSGHRRCACGSGPLCWGAGRSAERSTRSSPTDPPGAAAASSARASRT